MNPALNLLSPQVLELGRQKGEKKYQHYYPSGGGQVCLSTLSPEHCMSGGLSPIKV